MVTGGSGCGLAAVRYQPAWYISMQIAGRTKHMPAVECLTGACAGLQVRCVQQQPCCN
jgi:hypothetical protein